MHIYIYSKLLCNEDLFSLTDFIQVVTFADWKKIETFEKEEVRLNRFSIKHAYTIAHYDILHRGTREGPWPKR